jgi:F0F1-type ATP synthase membrane subunit c/vacuolar-type H+-ATPase subunit K
MVFKLATASPKRHERRAIALAVGILLALAACGCGGSSSATTSSSAGAAATTSSSTSTPTQTASTSTSTTATSSAGATTAAGTKLALGTPAIVDYEPGGSPKPTYRLQLTVLGIKKGSQTELDGVELEKSEQGKTPYYVTLRIQNVGSGDAGAEENQPAAAFQATDDRGQQGQELTVLGNFRPCPSVTQPTHFTHGVTYQTCVIYMVGGNGSIVQEEWTGNGADAYGENPIVWKAG